MAPVDPHVLLNTIAHLLDANGGLKNDRAVRQLITLMKLTEKLVNRAIYLQILAQTQSENILRTFLKNGGLEILLKWLSHFTFEHNRVFLLDTLNILGQLPFDSDLVQQIDIDELQLKIAELASAESGEKDIRESARRLYEVWSAKQLFTTTSNPTDSSLLDVDERTFSHSSSPPSTRPLITVDTSSFKHPLTSQTLNLDERHSSSANDSHIAAARKMATTAALTAGASSSSSHSSTDNSKRISEENIIPVNKKKSTHRHLTVQEQQQQISVMNVSPSSSMRPLGVSKVKRPSPPKTEEISESIDGLASAMSNSTTAKNLGSVSNRSTSTFRIPRLGRSTLGVPSSPTITSPNHGLSPSQTTTMETNESTPKEPLNIVKTGGVPLNRQSSDDLNSHQTKRKFSLSQYNERKRLKSNELQLQNSMADTDMRIMPSTITSNNNRNLKDSPPTPMDDDVPATVVDQPVVSPKIDESSKDTIIKSNLSEPGVKKVVKKKVIWADEKNQTLVQTSFFEMDDSEVADMHAFARTCASNISIAQLEKLMERDFRKRRGVTDMNSFDGDEKQFLPPLPTLRRILLPDTIQIPTIQSNERFVQEEREKTVLQALFIRSFLPDSPGEPDGDLLGGNGNIDRNEPKLIPLDDDNSSFESSRVSSVSSTVSNTINVSSISTSITTPAVVTNTPSLSSFSFGDISPEVAQILAQAKGNQLSATANNLSASTNPSTMTTTTTATATTTSLSINPPIVSPATTTTTTLPAPPNFLPALFNAARNSGADTGNLPSAHLIASLLPNLPPNFNLPPPPTSLTPLNQLLASAFPLSFPPSLTANVSLYQPPTSFTMPPPSIPASMINSVSSSTNSNSTSKPPPSVRFISAISQPPRSIQNSMNGNDQQQQQQQQQGSSSSRENSRDNNYRRGPSNSRNDNNRRDYHPNRNNNRNIFS